MPKLRKRSKGYGEGGVEGDVCVCVGGGGGVEQLPQGGLAKKAHHQCTNGQVTS
jgi:hypothetical protein